jgi:hypothetical protein
MDYVSKSSRSEVANSGLGQTKRLFFAPTHFAACLANEKKGPVYNHNQLGGSIKLHTNVSKI